eukprot:318054-Amphidinium_carterae.1
MIIQAVGLLDDLDKELNNFAMRLREWSVCCPPSHSSKAIRQVHRWYGPIATATNLVEMCAHSVMDQKSTGSIHFNKTFMFAEAPFGRSHLNISGSSGCTNIYHQRLLKFGEGVQENSRIDKTNLAGVIAPTRC